jgi:hypothetical protein
MRKFLLSFVLLILFVPSAQATVRPYTVDQVERGMYSFYHDVVSDYAPRNSTLWGTIICSRVNKKPARYRCVVNFRAERQGVTVRKYRWVFSRGRIIRYNCMHELYYMDYPGEFRARVEIPVLDLDNRGCVVFRVTGTNLPDPDHLIHD